MSDGSPEEHVRKRHRELSFSCKMCGKSGPLFADLSELRRHAESAHADKSSDDCTVAPADLRSVRCQLCDSAFHCAGLMEMRGHFESRHPSEEFHGGFLEWRCRLCCNGDDEKEFDDEEELSAHIADEHKGHIGSGGDADAGDGGEVAMEEDTKDGGGNDGKEEIKVEEEVVVDEREVSEEPPPPGE